MSTDPGEEPFVLRERWRCETLIARGGGKSVWRAFDEQLHRPVAIRILAPPEIRAPRDRPRLDQLLTVAATLRHDNVAHLYDAFEEDLGTVLVGELVEGPNLRELGDRLAPLPPDAVAAVGVQIADGIADIHAVGVAHRDLAPENVRVRHDGRVKILGLGDARLLADGAATPAIGIAEGSLYLAPEQLEGGPSDERTDIYALGLMLWELAAGRRPFDDDDVLGAVERRIQEDLPALRGGWSSVPRQLSRIIQTATRRDPTQRWQHAGDLSSALRSQHTDRPNTVLRDLARDLLPSPPPPVASLAPEARSASPASTEGVSLI